MSYNNMSGSVFLPKQLLARVDNGPDGNILSGNLSTSDAAEVINVPRLNNAVENAIVTNVGGDFNTLTTNGNLTFDGSTLGVTGDLTASVGISTAALQIAGSTFMSGAVSFKRKFVSSNYSVSTTDFYLGVDSTNSTVKLTLPVASNMRDGQTIIVKDEGGNASSNNITISGSASDTIDGQNQVILESPYASIQIYCNGINKFFIC